MQMAAEGQVALQSEELDVIRFQDGAVLVENDSGSVILDDDQAWQAATMIFGTDQDREPYCCEGESWD